MRKLQHSSFLVNRIPATGLNEQQIYNEKFNQNENKKLVKLYGLRGLNILKITNIRLLGLFVK